MAWSEQVFRYCERGHDAGLLAEPLNAVSSAAFLVTAWLAARRLMRLRNAAGGRQAPESFLISVLIALAALIGVGSLVFHLTAARWAQIADAAPITAFMLLYVVVALRAMLGLPWSWVTVGTAAFAGAVAGPAMACAWDAGETPGCLDGGAAYVPALLALLMVGRVLQVRGQPAGSRILVAAGIFLVALLLRTLDAALCESTQVLLARPLGLHFLWHVLNAAAVYVLIAAAMDQPTVRTDIRDTATPR